MNRLLVIRSLYGSASRARLSHTDFNQCIDRMPTESTA